jgi:TIR domain
MAPFMAHDVFICHSAEDRVVALAACAKLEANGIRCWIAPRDPIAGIPYARQLVDAIDVSRIILLIFSGNANKSEHVLRELELATDRNKPVIPFRTEDVLPTGDLEYYIQRVHWLDAMTPPLESRFEELATLARRILNMSRPSVESSVPAPPLTDASRAGLLAKRTRSLRLTLIASSVVLALGILVGVVLKAGPPLSQARNGATAPHGKDSKNTMLPVAVPSSETQSAADKSNCSIFINDPNPPTNVRDAPSSSGLVLTTLPNHTKLTVHSHDHGWSHISSPVVAGCSVL